MITFKISPVNTATYDIELLKTIQNAINVQIQKKKFLTGFITGSDISISGNEIKIQFNGVSVSRENESELYTYIFNLFNELLVKAGVRDVVYVSGTGFKECLGDTIFTTRDAINPVTRNQTLLGNLIPDSEIPEELKCALSDQIMDSPVSVAGDATKKQYNKAHLKYHLFTKEVQNQVDPFTRAVIDPTTDLVKNEVLKSQIREFVRQKMKEKAAERVERLKLVEQKYFKGSVTREGLQALLRQCAGENDLIAVDVLISHFNLNVDAKDSTPGSCKTALHHAINNNHVEMAKLLISKGAKTDVKDAHGKSPSACAIESGDPELISVVMGNVDLTKVVTAAKQSSKKL